MQYRLNGPDHGGLAEFRKIGIGALLGLSDPLGEMFFRTSCKSFIKRILENIFADFSSQDASCKGDFNNVVKCN